MALVRGGESAQRSRRDLGEAFVVPDVVPKDVAFVLEQIAKPLLELGRRRYHLDVASEDAVANPSEKVRDGVSH